MLASLRDLSDWSTRRRYEQQHAALDKETRLLQVDAETERQRLQNIIHQWQEFADVLTGERDRLGKLASMRQQAAAVAVMDTATLHELHQTIAEYEDMQQSFGSRKSYMIQVCTQMCLLQPTFFEFFKDLKNCLWLLHQYMIWLLVLATVSITT